MKFGQVAFKLLSYLIPEGYFEIFFTFLNGIFTQIFLDLGQLQYVFAKENVVCNPIAL